MGPYKHIWQSSVINEATVCDTAEQECSHDFLVHLHYSLLGYALAMSQ